MDLGRHIEARRHDSLCAPGSHTQQSATLLPGAPDKGKPQGGPLAPCGDVRRSH